MITIANPIYDTVFKHLMENHEVALALVSQLLGLEILTLEPQPQELTDYAADVPSDGSFIRIFRLDFAAVIRTAHGETKRVLIELQKASKSESAGRFRRYIGKHYALPPGAQQPLPLVAIYLLGFWINEQLPTVIKVQRHYIDGVHGHAVSPELKEPFIEMLTHDAVLVQIPGIGRLTGRSELEAALAVFDQSHTLGDPHLLEISESALKDAPAWLQKLIRVLQNAAADTAVRAQMAVEDEATSLLERTEAITQERDDERRQKEAALALSAEERRQKEAALALSEEERRQKEEERRQKLAALERIQELERQLRRSE